MKKLPEACSTIILESEKIKTVHRKTRLNDFTILPNRLLKDKRLSFKARGVLAMMLAMPDDWQTYAGWIEEQGTEGRDALQGAFRELENLGYLSRQRVLDKETKKFTCYQWSWFDEPYDGFPADGLPAGGKPATTKYPLYQVQNNQEAKESAFAKPEIGFYSKSISKSISKPESKAKQLAKLPDSENHPSEAMFNEFLHLKDLKFIIEYRPELYDTWKRDKWHVWKQALKKWVPIINWQKMVVAFDAKIEKSKNRR